MFKTEKVASIAVLAMVLGDVAVLHTWDPGILNGRQKTERTLVLKILLVGAVRLYL